MNQKQKQKIKSLLTMHYLYLLAADQYLSTAMRGIEQAGDKFKHEEKRKMNAMLDNAKALDRRYSELFDFLYGLHTEPTQPDMMRRDATFLARLGCKAMDRIAEDPKRAQMVENAVTRLKTTGLFSDEEIDRIFTFR